MIHFRWTDIKCTNAIQAGLETFHFHLLSDSAVYLSLRVHHGSVRLEFFLLMKFPFFFSYEEVRLLKCFDYDETLFCHQKPCRQGHDFIHSSGGSMINLYKDGM